MTAIALRQITKHFGSVAAVQEVTLEIPQGCLFFLLGPSGCGKTTLLRMIAGFLEPDHGEILFGSREVTRLPPEQRDTAMVFQGYALWPHMTVRENVAFGLTVRKIPTAEKNARVDAALREVQMLACAGRKPNELSGGQQQRVALARALVVRPQVLLLDEPLANLDAKLRLEMRSQIRTICRQAGSTSVYVTHDQKEALSMADQIAVLRDGKVVQAGPPQQLYRRPNSRFVADFLGETNIINAQLIGREGDLALLEGPGGRFRSSVLPENLPARGGVTCSIRPEALRILGPQEQAGDQNVFTAQLGERVYLGEMAQHQLLLPGQSMLKVYELNPQIRPQTGPDLRVACDPQDVVILQD